MAATLAVVLGFLVIIALVYGAISQFRRRQAELEARAAERERTGEAEELRRLHAERERRAGSDD